LDYFRKSIILGNQLDYFFCKNNYIYINYMVKLTLSKMEDVFSTIDTSATAIDELDLRVDALDLRVDALDLRVAANTTAIAANTTAIAAANTTAIAAVDLRVDANDTAIAANTTAIAANTTAIDELDLRVDALDLRVAANTTAIAANTTAIAAVDSRVAANTTAIAAVDSRVAANTTAIAATTTAIAAVDSRVAANTTAIAATTTAIAAVDLRVSDLEKETPCLTIYRDVSDTYTSDNPYVRFDGTIGIQTSGISFSSANLQGTRFTVGKSGIYVIDYSLFGNAFGGSLGNNNGKPNFELIDGNDNRVVSTPALSVPEDSWNGILTTSFITRLIPNTQYRVKLTNASFTTIFNYTNNSLTTYNAPGPYNTSASFTIFKLA
jgi:hypothetical protein